MPIAIIQDEAIEKSFSTATRVIDRQPAALLKGSSQCLTREAYTMMMKREREREGRCADCGGQTHEIRVDTRTHHYLKAPLTIENEVLRGRCLLCHPIITLGGQKHSRTEHSHHRARELVCPDNSAERLAVTAIDGSCLEILDILSVMKRFPRSLYVQERGCERLWVLSWEDENSSAIGRVGGIPIIVAAMARFSDNLHIQQCGCESLQNLALNDYNRNEIYEQGAITLIMHAMTRFPSVAEIQQCGCTALANIATCKAHRFAIEREGGLTAILTAATIFPERESVVRAAVDALRALGYDSGESVQAPVVIDMEL